MVARAIGGQRLVPKSAWDNQPVSDVVYPRQRLPLRFSHADHLRVGADCVDCHTRAAQSRSALDNLLPTEAECRRCHAIDRTQPEKRATPPVRCRACHPTYDARSGSVDRIVLPTPNLKFSHAAHTEKGMTCQSCHGDLVSDNVALATRDQLPRMGFCLQCHNGRKAANGCDVCHPSVGRGRIRTQFASGDLVPSGTLRGAAHSSVFRTDHARVARSDAAYCDTCHRKNFCIDCHNGTVKPMDFHANDYVRIHALEARRNQPDCSSCHRVQTFCVGCHSRSGLSADGRASDFTRRLSGNDGPRFHPTGWVNYADGTPIGGVRGPQHHSIQAQRNIRQCAACHREEFCISCHSAAPAAIRINPHPRNWRNSRRCRTLAAKAQRMCLRCHIEGARCGA